MVIIRGVCGAISLHKPQRRPVAVVHTVFHFKAEVVLSEAVLQIKRTALSWIAALKCFNATGKEPRQIIVTWPVLGVGTGLPVKLTPGAPSVLIGLEPEFKRLGGIVTAVSAGMPAAATGSIITAAAAAAHTCSSIVWYLSTAAPSAGRKCRFGHLPHRLVRRQKGSDHFLRD